jgi:hypothetical protein
MKLFYQFMQIILLHLYETVLSIYADNTETVPKADHHSVFSFFTTHPTMPFARPQTGSPFLRNLQHPHQ